MKLVTAGAENLDFIEAVTNGIADDREINQKETDYERKNEQISGSRLFLVKGHVLLLDLFRRRDFLSLTFLLFICAFYKFIHQSISPFHPSILTKPSEPTS